MATSTNVNLTVVPVNVYATAGFNTIYSNVPQTNAINFLVGAAASAQITNPNYTSDPVLGFHQLETIQIQASYTNFTAWSNSGQVTLTNAGAGQTVVFQLTQPNSANGGGNNSGVNVQFLDGSLAFTSNISSSGAWTVWITQGSATTTNWGVNSQTAPYTAATALNLATLGASGTNTVNTAVNSSSVTNWTGSNVTTTYTLTLGLDTNASLGVPSTLSNATFTAPLLASTTTPGGQSQTLTAGDSIIVTGTGNVLNATLNASVALGTWSGVQTFNLSAVGGNSIITGANTISGLTTLNNAGSTGQLTIGAAGKGLPAPLTTIGLTTVANGAAGLTTVFENAAALGGASTLALNLSSTGATGTSTAAQLVVAADSGSTSAPKTLAITATGSNYIQYSATQADTATSIAGLTSVTVAGSGSIELSTNASGTTFNNVNIISVTGTAAVTITGALSSGAGAAGALSNDVKALTVTGGSGGISIDLSNQTLSQINADTITGNATGANTLIINNTVATTATATTASKLVNIQTLAVTGASGTMDLSKLGSALKTLRLANTETGNVTLNNAPTNFTFDTGTNLNSSITTNNTINGPLTGSNVATILFGNATSSANDQTFASLTTTGYNTINLVSTSLNGAAAHSDSGAISFTANAGQTFTVNVSGNTAFSLGNTVTFTGGIGATLNNTNTAMLTLGATNATVINAATSGGLTEQNANTSTGAAITGSTTVANVLYGSTGADSVTDGLANDILVTNGGADTITMNVKSAVDTIDFFAAIPGAINAATGGLTGSTLTNADVAQPGFFGTSQGATTNLPALYINAKTGISTSQATVANFGSGAVDVIQFSLASEKGAADTINNGFVMGDGTTAVTATNTPSVQLVTSAGTMLLATTNVIEMTAANTFANAAALATALGNGGPLSLTFAGSGVGAGKDSHLLIAYQDASGNAHIADADFINQSSGSITSTSGFGAAASSTGLVISDVVQLTGVPVANINAANIHFVL